MRRRADVGLGDLRLSGSRGCHHDSDAFAEEARLERRGGINMATAVRCCDLEAGTDSSLGR